MNQILSVSMPEDDNKKNKGREKKNRNVNRKPVNIKNVMMIFAIILIIFSVSTIGVSAYSIVGNKKVEELNTKPTISIENKDEKTLLLKVMHQRAISNVKYNWNDEDEIIINGNSRKYIEQTIAIPSGTNTLYITATDENGQTISYEKQYETNSNINIVVSGNKIKITSSSETTISYMTYRWDDDDEKQIEVNSKELSEEIEAIKGLHTLTIITVDENNNTDTKTQKINGVAKPKVIIDVDDAKEHFVLTASDDTALKKIEIVLDQDEEQTYVINTTEQEMDFALPMELHEGDNYIKVKVYNSSDVTDEAEAKFVKQ